MNNIGDINGQNILLFQGPMGSFFKRLDVAFRAQGATTYKVGLNAGDAYYSNGDNYILFRAQPYRWEAFITRLMYDKMIDKLFLFGDCRFYQRVAINAAHEMGVEVFVFEEGYVRPDYVTMERYGVNDFSYISRQRTFYDTLKPEEIPEPVTLPSTPNAFNMMGSAMVYYIISNILFFMYPHYRHHRDFNALKEAFYGLRNFYRKQRYRIKERGFEKHIIRYMKQQYYFVPLQTHNDFQIHQHSQYDSIETFIGEVLESFSCCAPKNCFLMIKHHPMDRGRKDYEPMILEKAEAMGILQRVIVVYDVHLPTILKNAIGTITINSTVGLSSILHGTPTITLGNAIYDIEGMTCQGMALDDFWRDYQKPDHELFERYRNYLIANTQLNGSFFGQFPLALAGEDGSLAKRLSV